MQSLQMLIDRLQGKQPADIAADYAVTPRQVEAQTLELWEDEVVDRLREQMLTRLASLAMGVYETHLRLGNLEAARDIATSIGLLRKPVSKKDVTIRPGEPRNEIDAYRLERQKRRYVPVERGVRFADTGDIDDLQ